MPKRSAKNKNASKANVKKAKTSLGTPEEVTPRPLPKVLFGHPPELANKIFKDVDPIDLLNLATVSKSSRELVESLSIKVKDISVRYHSARAEIAIKMANDKRFEFEISTSRKLVKKSRRDKTIRRIGNDEFVIERDQRCENCYVIHCSDKEQLARVLSRFFLGIYRTEDVSFCIDSPKKDFMMYVIKNITTRFSRFEIAANLKLKDEEFRIVMEDISVKDWFRFKSDREHNYDRPFQHKIMAIDMPWKLNNLIGMRCERLYLNKREFPVEDLKAFAQSWKEGGMTQLEKVTFDWLGMGWKNIVWTSLKSLGFTDQPPQLPLPSEMERDEPENLLHIQREDGRVASLRFFTTRYKRV